MDTDERKDRYAASGRDGGGPAGAAPAGADTEDALQLRLIDVVETPDWRLDDTTKAIGLNGIERARAALGAARRRHAELEEQPNRPGGDAGRATAA